MRFISGLAVGWVAMCFLIVGGCSLAVCLFKALAGGMNSFDDIVVLGGSLALTVIGFLGMRFSDRKRLFNGM